MLSTHFYFLPGIKTLLTCLIIGATLVGCGTQPTQHEPIPQRQRTFVDSTLYFDNRINSISMRATFEKSNSTKMAKGYLFQFRTISKKPIFLSSVSIIVGGKRIFLEEGQLLLAKNKSLTLSLPLEDSILVSEFPKALFQFKHNNTSELFTIELHQLDIFNPS